MLCNVMSMPNALVSIVCKVLGSLELVQQFQVQHLGVLVWWWWYRVGQGWVFLVPLGCLLHQVGNQVHYK